MLNKNIMSAILLSAATDYAMGQSLSLEAEPSCYDRKTKVFDDKKCKKDENCGQFKLNNVAI